MWTKIKRKLQRKVTCRKCGRSLWGPEARAAGIGESCLNAERQELLSKHSQGPVIVEGSTTRELPSVAIVPNKNNIVITEQYPPDWEHA